jgi:glyoxylase-like metal-dependent hydrolase (beta-lactamase superfamily II)
MTKPKHQIFGSSFEIYPIRGLLGYIHLLYDSSRNEAVLIDTGLIGEVAKLHRILQSLHLEWGDIKAILLTHGHLDHTSNLAALKKLTEAPLLAHPLEQPHIDGSFKYSGINHWCGCLEGFGRWAFNYHTVPIDEPLSDGMELPYWGGLRVIHLPGHTEGHCGFYSQRHNLLFSGDLFASYSFSSHLPPPIFNSCPQYLKSSLQKVAALSPELIIPNHYDTIDWALHKKRFYQLIRKHSR